MKIVFDLDGTILAFNKFRKDEIFGGPIEGAANFISLAKLFDHKVLLWSSRPRADIILYLSHLVLGTAVERYEEYFADFFGHRGVYQFINKIPDDWQIGSCPRLKPYYDWQLDDRTFSADIPNLKWKPRQWTPLSWARACVILYKASNIDNFIAKYDPMKIRYLLLNEFEDLYASLRGYQSLKMNRKYVLRGIFGNRRTKKRGLYPVLDDYDYVSDPNTFLIRWELRATLLEIRAIIGECRRLIRKAKP